MRLLVWCVLAVVACAQIAIVNPNEPKITTVPVKGVNELPTEAENKHTYKPVVPPQPTLKVEVFTPAPTPKPVKATITGPTQPVAVTSIPTPPTSIHQVIDLPGPSTAVEAEEVMTPPASPPPLGPYVLPEAKPEPADVVQPPPPLTIEQIAAAIRAAMPKPVEYQSVQEYKPEPPKIATLSSLTPEQLQKIVLAAAQATPVQPTIANSIEYSEPEYKPTKEQEDAAKSAFTLKEPLTQEQVAAAIKAIMDLQPKGTEFVQPEFKPQAPMTISGLDHLMVTLKENPSLAQQFQSNPELMTQLVVHIVQQQQLAQQQAQATAPAPTLTSNAPTSGANPILVQRRSHLKARKHQH